MDESNQQLDLIIRSGHVVTETGVHRTDIGVRDGKIAKLEPVLPDQAARTIDALGQLVFPGFIDAHTHMGIPIMNTHSADDFASGSIAAAFGGVTTIVDFTVQEQGQSLRESIEVRVGKANGNCHVDYALHVNITNQPEVRVGEIPELISEGFRNFKVFSTYRQAGMMVTWDQFRQVLGAVDQNGGLIFLHAEDNDIVEGRTETNIKAGRFGAKYHGHSRPPEAEATAIKRASEIARDLDAELYIVHLSSRHGLKTALGARERGTRLHLETCPQYLLLIDDVLRKENGHNWITTPPLRAQEDVDALWEALAEGLIDVVATDHCPFTVRQKSVGSEAFHLTPNGLPGVETLLPLLYTYGVNKQRIALQQLVNLLAKNPARLCGLYPRKGEIRIGADADFAIWNPNETYSIRSENLHGTADWSPYEGMAIDGKLEYTILRGQVLVKGEEFLGKNVFGTLLLSEERN